MRRSILTLAAAAVIGLSFAASEASACGCKKKTCATTVVCVPPPPVCVPPPPVCPPVACAPVVKKHHGMKLFAHHKKAACAPTMVGYAPVAYAAPVYPTGQAYPSMQK